MGVLAETAKQGHSGTLGVSWEAAPTSHVHALPVHGPHMQAINYNIYPSRSTPTPCLPCRCHPHSTPPPTSHVHAQAVHGPHPRHRRAHRRQLRQQVGPAPLDVAAEHQHVGNDTCRVQGGHARVPAACAQGSMSGSNMFRGHPAWYTLPGAEGRGGRAYGAGWSSMCR